MSYPTGFKKESGLGDVDASSYADDNDGAYYFTSSPYAAAWVAANAATKKESLERATRLIDSQFRFNGHRSTLTQALQWPRSGCREPDGTTAQFCLNNVAVTPREGTDFGFVPANVIPREIVIATIEMAREVTLADRTTAPVGEGLKYSNVGTTQTGYDKLDHRPIIPVHVQALLSKYGSMVNPKGGSVQLARA